jgi:tRNA-dihydrouridine synthase B
VAIPVIANGDIREPADARRALALSGARGVMVGRGAQGRPWQLATIASALGGKPARAIPVGAQLAALVAGHYEDMLSFYGVELGMRVARKHLGWYMDEAATPAALRREILTSIRPADVLRRLPAAFAAPEALAA